MLFSQSSCLFCYFSQNCIRNPNSTCVFRSTTGLSRLSTICLDWHNSHPTRTSTDSITMVVDGGSERWRSYKVDLSSLANLTKTPLFHPFPKSSLSRSGGDHEISNEDPLESRLLPPLLVWTEIDLTCWKSNSIRSLDAFGWWQVLCSATNGDQPTCVENDAFGWWPVKISYCWKWLFSI